MAPAIGPLVDYPLPEYAPIYDQHLPPVHNKPYVFTTVRWAPELVKSADNTAASCGRPCPFYMLEHHWTRLQVVRWSSDLPRSDPADLLRSLHGAVREWHRTHPEQKPDALRLRHRVYYTGETYTEIQALPSISVGTLFPVTLGKPEDESPKIVWTATIDTEPTEVSAATMYKTSDRGFYDRARQHAGIELYTIPREVLMFNTDNEILDASISTPYFFRGGQWVTPEAACGGQQGTTRRWALERHYCIEGIIKKDELREGEAIWLSNASKGFFRAIYMPTQGHS